MTARERRETILQRLRDGEGPVSATLLAGLCGVSRQVIVGDIALIRAGGTAVAATPRGYVLPLEGGCVRKVVCAHTDAGMVEELMTMVDGGCSILNVAVDHPIYGTLIGELRISSRQDVMIFADRVRQADARPLSALTRGIHTHDLLCPDEAAFEAVREKLKNKGFLLET